jgi:hypothetical protein
MMRKCLGLLVATAVGLAGTTAVSAAQNSTLPQNPAPSVTAEAASKTDRPAVAPLPAGQAAGIKQAQGSGQTAWHIVGLGFIGGVGLAMILIDGDDPSAPTTSN